MTSTQNSQTSAFVGMIALDAHRRQVVKAIQIVGHVVDGASHVSVYQSRLT